MATVKKQSRFCEGLIIMMLHLCLSGVSAQTKINYNIFNRSPLSQLRIISLTPQVTMFSPVDIYHVNTQPNTSIQQNQILYHDNTIEQQNQKLLQENSSGLSGQQGASKREKIMSDINNDVIEFEKSVSYNQQMNLLIKQQSYEQAYNELMKFNPDNFSITKAVFIVEDAYYSNNLSYDSLLKTLTERVLLVKQILNREKLNIKNNLALNYGIQKLYSQQNIFYNTKTKQSILVPKIKYDFDDFMGQKDYSKMFVSKLLATGKGQCHSMPLLYLMIAEQLNAKAYLSLAPEHSFIKFIDKSGSLINFETTNGNLVSDTWLAQSGFITAQALQNKIYLDTLSQRQLFAQMMCDLLLGYLSAFAYDNFAEQVRQKILELNPVNTTALIIDANVKMQIAKQQIYKAGKPKEADLPNHPDAYNAYLTMQAAFDKIDNLGYQDMPKEAYQKWLASIEEEKKKEANRQLTEKLQKEILQTKRSKVHP